MNKEQVYNILSKRAAQQTKQGDPIKQFLQRVLGPSVMDYRNGADILRLHLNERHKKLQEFLKRIMPLRKPVPAANNSDHVKQACLWGLMKTAYSSSSYELLKDKVQSLNPVQLIDRYFSTLKPTLFPWEDHIKSNPAAPGATPVLTKPTAKNTALPKQLDKPKKLGLPKTPEKPGTPDPWSRWGGKLIGGGLGGLGLYGIMSIFTNSPILRALAFLFGAGAGGYMGHTYDAYKASRVPSSKVPGNKPTT